MDTYGPKTQAQTTFRTPPVQPLPVQPLPAPLPTPVKTISTSLKPHEITRLRGSLGSDMEAAATAYQIDPDFRKRTDNAMKVQDQLSPSARRKMATMLLNKHYHGDYNYKAKPTALTESLLAFQNPANTEAPGFLARMENRQKQAFQNTLEGAEKFHQKPSLDSLTDAVVGGAANMFSGLVAPITETSSTVVGGALKMTGLDKPLAEGVQAVANSSLGQAAGDLYGKVQERAPDELRTFQAGGKAAIDATDVFGTGLVAKAVPNVTRQAAKAGVNVTRQGTQLAGTALRGIIKRDFDEVIAKGMNKGVKQQFRGAMRNSATALPEYNKKASEAVRQILKNKSTLNFTDDAGEVITGQSPRNLSEFAQAIDQSKKALFAEYSGLSQAAQGQGMRIDFDDIVNKLLEYADNPVKQVADSGKTQYALKMADKLMKQGSLDPKQVEDLIADMNRSLAPSYADKSAKGVSEVDLTVANILRQKLDDVVEQATGRDYQELKNAYGALKTIEKDVGHRALIVARQNAKSLPDMTDIFSGGDLVAGVVTMNPAFFFRGLAQTGLKSWFKNLNSPDANIMRMFYRASKLYDDAGKAAGSIDDAARATDDVINAGAASRDAAGPTVSRAAEIRDMEQYVTDLQNHIGTLESEVAALPDLRKFANRKTGEVPEVTGRGSQFARKGDDMATEMGFEDSEGLRDSHARSTTLREKIQRLKENEKESRSVLQEMKKGRRPAENLSVDEPPPFATDLSQTFATAGERIPVRSGNQQPPDITNLTPEERATGLFGGGGDGMPRGVKGGGEVGAGMERFIQEPNSSGISQYTGSEKVISTNGKIQKLKGENGSYRYIYRENGKIVGGAQLVTGKGRPTVLSNIYVDPQFRRQGIATKLQDSIKADYPNMKVADTLTPDGEKLFNPSPLSKADVDVPSAKDGKYAPTSEYFQGKGMSKELADFASQNAKDMMDMKSPTVADVASGRFGSDRPMKGEMTIYRVVPKGEKINDADFVFTDKAEATQFQKDYGFKRGQQEIISMKVRGEDLIVPKGNFSNEAIFSPLSKADVDVPSAKEAIAKGMTEDEFVKGQGTPLYHGTASKFDTFSADKIGDVAQSDLGNGFYFSDSKDIAKSFANDAGGDIVMDIRTPGVKFADGNKLMNDPDFNNILDDGMGFVEIGDYLKEKGYGGLKFKHSDGGGIEYVVYDTKLIKTTSQLRAEYQAAKATAAKVPKKLEAL